MLDQYGNPTPGTWFFVGLACMVTGLFVMRHVDKQPRKAEKAELVLTMLLLFGGLGMVAWSFYLPHLEQVVRYSEWFHHR